MVLDLTPGTASRIAGFPFQNDCSDHGEEQWSGLECDTRARTMDVKQGRVSDGMESFLPDPSGMLVLIKCLSIVACAPQLERKYAKLYR